MLIFQSSPLCCCMWIDFVSELNFSVLLRAAMSTCTHHLVEEFVVTMKLISAAQKKWKPQKALKNYRSRAPVEGSWSLWTGCWKQLDLLHGTLRRADVAEAVGCDCDSYCELAQSAFGSQLRLHFREMVFVLAERALSGRAARQATQIIFPCVPTQVNRLALPEAAGSSRVSAALVPWECVLLA